MLDTLVVIPTYNERENIVDIIKAVQYLDKGYHVLIVDDSSPDGTGELVQSIDGFGDDVFLETRTGKLGLGTAYIHGFKYGVKKGYKYICEMDADFSHNPLDLIRLRAACESGADLAIGSRYIKGGGVKDWPFNRRLMSYGASLYVQAILFMSIKDPTAGFKCYNVNLLKAMDLDAVTFKGYAFQIGMKYQAYRRKAKIIEVPILFKDREKGTSKMSLSIFKEAMWGVVKMRFKS